MPRKRTAPSLIGKKFGRWVVVAEPKTCSRLVQVNCRCSCGLVKKVWKYNLLNGRSQGCVRCQKTRHGHTNQPQARQLPQLRRKGYRGVQAVAQVRELP